jgi:branched-chain amino acid aminotransferase
MKISIDGRLVPERQASVSVFDHGLLYGDGVFEGIRIYNGRVFKLQEHLDRLYEGARAIAMTIPVSPAKLTRDVLAACRANRLRDGYIRLVVTRGKGSLGLSPHSCAKPRIIIIAASIQLYPKELYRTGMSIITCGTPRNLPEATNPRVKSLNYLNNIMAKIEAQNAGVPEGIMLNALGHVAEATGDNVFAVRRGALYTPPVWSGILKGITRDTVMELAAGAGVRVEESVMTRFDLYTADEIFLTGTAAEVIAVTKIDGRTIGDGAPGPVTCRLSQMFSKYARAHGTPIPA